MPPAARPVQRETATRSGAASGSSVVCKLHVDAEVPGSQHRNHLLQRVAILSPDPDIIALNAGLNFQLAVFDRFDNLFGFICGNPLLQGDLLTCAAMSR